MNPLATVNYIPMHIGAFNPISVERELFELIASADLVIESTGKHGVSRFLNDVSHNTGTPIVYASVTNGAWAGEIVRYIPGETACWLCWDNQYTSPPPAAPNPSGHFYAPGCAQPSFTGATHEVGLVANLATTMAIDTLLRTEIGRERISADYLRWILRDANGNFVFNTEALPISQREYCPFCNP